MQLLMCYYFGLNWIFYFFWGVLFWFYLVMVAAWWATVRIWLCLIQGHWVDPWLFSFNLFDWLISSFSFLIAVVEGLENNQFLEKWTSPVRWITSTRCSQQVSTSIFSLIISYMRFLKCSTNSFLFWVFRMNFIFRFR